MSITPPSVEDALLSLSPGSEWSVVYDGNGDYEIDWRSPTTQPSDEDIAKEIARLRQIWEDRQYITLRREAYPSLADFADAFYWQQQGDDTKMMAYLAKIEAVKIRYPKPESVMVEVVPTPEYVHRDQPPQEGEEPIA